MSLTPDEYVNYRLQKIEDREGKMIEGITINQQRIDDMISSIRSEFAVVKTKLDILFAVSGALALGFFGVLIDLFLKK